MELSSIIRPNMRRSKMKKAPSEISEGAQKLRHGVHLQRDAALLAGRGILVQNAFGNTLIDCLNGSLVSSGGLLAVAGGHCDIKLLDRGLQSRLGHTIALVLDLAQLDSLLSGFNVGHGYTSSIAIVVFQTSKCSHAGIHYSVQFQ